MGVPVVETPSSRFWDLTKEKQEMSKTSEKVEQAEEFIKSKDNHWWITALQVTRDLVLTCLGIDLLF